jgi:S1-C subfamily serine protease
VGVEEKSVATVDDIHRLLGSASGGARLRLAVLRDGERREVGVIAGEG